MAAALIALGLVAVVTLPLPFSYTAGLHRVRDLWLRGVLLGAILVVPPFLAPIVAWWAWQWPLEAEPWRLLPQLIAWVGVGLSWTLIARLEPTWWPGVAAGWTCYAAIQVGYLVVHAAQQGRKGWVSRQMGYQMGTPVQLALFLALTAPFWPTWGYPVLVLGLWLTSSYAAFLALGVGALVYYVPWR